MLEIVKQISRYKADIKKASKNILANLNNQQTSTNIDNEILDILDALGNIVIWVNNHSLITDHTKEWYDIINPALNSKPIKIQLVKRCLAFVCMLSVSIDRKGKKYEIKLPDISFIKIG